METEKISKKEKMKEMFKAKQNKLNKAEIFKVKQERVVNEEITKVKNEQIIIKNKLDEIYEKYKDLEYKKNYIIKHSNLKKCKLLIEKLYITPQNTENQIIIYENLQKENILVFINHNKLFELYNLNTKKSIILKDNIYQQIKDSLCMHHCFDIINKEELLLIAFNSKERNSKIIIYNLNKQKIILEIIQNKSNLFYNLLAIMISDKKIGNFIIYCKTYDCLTIYNMNGKIELTKKINNLIYFLDFYYFHFKYYIITGQQGKIIVYNLDNLSEYKTFEDKLFKGSPHNSIIIKEFNNSIYLIELETSNVLNLYSNLRVWDFFSGELLRCINIKFPLNGLCLFNEKYFYSGGEENNIFLLDVISGKVIQKSYFKGLNIIIYLKTIKYFDNKEYVIALNKDGQIFILN